MSLHMILTHLCRLSLLLLSTRIPSPEVFVLLLFLFLLARCLLCDRAVIAWIGFAGADTSGFLKLEA
jgi:hypothetical protein